MPRESGATLRGGATILPALASVFCAVSLATSPLPARAEITGTSRAETGEPERIPLVAQELAIRAVGGGISFTDLQGNVTSRAAAGLALDVDLAWWAPPGSRSYSIELATGGIFSHLGSTSSNFLGQEPAALITNPGSNLMLIPADLKIGWNVRDHVRISAHAGANIVYCSASSSIDLGPSSATSGASWAIFPDLGADLELGAGGRFSILLRPDLTMTAGTSVFSWLLGFGFGLG